MAGRAVTVRPATVADLPDVVDLLVEHAEFEGAPDPEAIRGKPWRDLLFGTAPVARVTVVEAPDSPGVVVGLALWHLTFSSWLGTSGIWIEDLYLRRAHRRSGLGRALMADLRTRTEGKVEWDVARDNTDGQAFYDSVGAIAMPEWIRYRWDPPR